METSPAPLDDLYSMRVCSSSTKRVCSILTVVKRVNLEMVYKSSVWKGMELVQYHNVADWLQGANTPEACSVNGFADICWGMPGDAAVLE